MLVSVSVANAQTERHHQLDSLKQVYYALQDGGKRMAVCCQIVELSNVDSSLVWGKRLEELSYEYENQYYRLKACSKLCWANMYSDYKQGIVYGNRAVEVADSIGDLKVKAMMLHYLALLQYLERNFSESFGHLFEALDVYRKIGDKSGETSCLRSIADNNFYLKKYSESDSLLLEALRIDEPIGDPDAIARDYVGLADSRIYQYQEHFANADTALILSAKQYVLRAWDVVKDKTFGFKLSPARCLCDVLLTEAEEMHYDADRRAVLLDSVHQACDNFLYYEKLVGGTREIHRGLVRKLRYLICNADFEAAGQLLDSINSFRSDKALDSDEEYYWALMKYYEAIGDFRNANAVSKLYFELRLNEASIALAVETTHDLENARLQQHVYDDYRRRILLRFALSIAVLALAFFVWEFYRKRRYANTLSEKNKSITDSITYASLIQKAVLPSDEAMRNVFDQYYVIYRPLHIVSGDFYWINTCGKYKVIVCADCTGHGVPGAFVSMLGITLLNEIVVDYISRGRSAANILNEMRIRLMRSLGQSKDKFDNGTLYSQDGMDLSLVIMDTENGTVRFAGAYRPLWIWRDGEILQYKPDKMPIGLYIGPERSFSEQEIEIHEGDMLYMFSDGIPDQFGYTDDTHTECRHFSTKRLLRLLRTVGGMPLCEQKAMIEHTMDAWKNGYQQLDDNILIGIRI